VGVSGWSSSNNLAWDGVSHWNDALLLIEELQPAVGVAQTRRLLERYYEILDMDEGVEKGNRLADFREELEAKRKQTEQ
jgi:hypothetical protein